MVEADCFQIKIKSGEVMTNSNRGTMKFLPPAVLLVATFAAFIPHHAQAQIDPGSHYTQSLFDHGVQVGEVYVLDRAPGQTQYAEDWVLYPNYAHSGPRFIGALDVVPGTLHYQSESDFFSKVPFPAGSKFVRVSAEEFSSLPVTR
jgi:hypothetical protein